MLPSLVQIFLTVKWYILSFSRQLFYCSSELYQTLDCIMNLSVYQLYNEESFNQFQTYYCDIIHHLDRILLLSKRATFPSYVNNSFKEKLNRKKNCFSFHLLFSNRYAIDIKIVKIYHNKGTIKIPLMTCGDCLYNFLQNKKRI